MPTRYWRFFVPFACLALLGITPVACRDSGSPTGPLSPGAIITPAPGPSDPQVAAFVTLVNHHRTSLGLAPLAWRADVAAVAQAHSQDMLDRNYFSHTTPEGATPWDRLAAAGITYASAGENIAYGYPTAETVLAAWLASPGHKANIENPNFTHQGIGLAGTYWTHVFIQASPAAASHLALAGARPSR